ncbi:transposable element Tcb1 transposase [Trichonephila clavipes]|nr:transposable element Tcb1 transposase [Trichonephila clavipes]
MEAGWTARQVARQSDRSDCVVRRCWDQWIREMSFTRRPGSGRPRQTCRRADNHIVRNARVQLTASSSVIQVQVAPSRRGPVSSRTIQRRLAEGYLIRGTLTAQWYDHVILQPHALPLMQWLPGASFQQDNARTHTTMVSQDCLGAVTTLPWPA